MRAPRDLSHVQRSAPDPDVSIKGNSKISSTEQPPPSDRPNPSGAPNNLESPARVKLRTHPVLGDGTVNISPLMEEHPQLADELKLKEHQFNLADLTKALGEAKDTTLARSFIKPQVPERLILEDFKLTNTPSDGDALRFHLHAHYLGQEEVKAASYYFQGIEIVRSPRRSAAYGANTQAPCAGGVST